MLEFNVCLVSCRRSVACESVIWISSIPKWNWSSSSWVFPAVMSQSLCHQSDMISLANFQVSWKLTCAGFHFLSLVIFRRYHAFQGVASGSLVALCALQRFCSTVDLTWLLLRFNTFRCRMRQPNNALGPFAWTSSYSSVFSFSSLEGRHEHHWTWGVQVKLWDPLRTCAIPEHLRGVFMMRRYTNPRYLTLSYWNRVLISNCYLPI